VDEYGQVIDVYVSPRRDGTVNLLKLSGSTGTVGSGCGRISGAVGHAVVVVPVTSFQVVNRTVISQRYSSARSW